MLDVSLIKTGPTLVISIAIAPPGGPPPPGPPAELCVPWQDLQSNADEPSLLSWRTRLSKFSGLEKQMQELRDWALNGISVSVKFLCGEGGMGKSRTAAEFADSLIERDNWAAGFVDLRKAQSYNGSEKGTLLVVDYPEENRFEVGELLKDLVNLGSGNRPPIRVLFLTRRSLEDWNDLIFDSKANTVVDRKPVLVQGLRGTDAWKAFCSAQEAAADNRDLTPLPVSEEQLAHWLELWPENKRALFIVAAAVHSVIEPADLVVRYSGTKVVQSIAEREVAGLRNMAQAAGLKDDYVIGRILAVAAVAGGMTRETAIKIARDRPDLLGLGDGEGMERALRGITVGLDKLIPAPKPDILAAAILVRVLGEAPASAPETIWLGIEPDVAAGLSRVARLSYDSEIVLQMHTHRVSDWLAAAVRGRKDRCEIVEPHFLAPPLPMAWIKAAVVARQTLLDSLEMGEEKARVLNNLSVDLSAAGDNAGALDAIREAVKIRRRLAEAEPARYAPDLAMSLNNLSNRLSAAGDNAGALGAIREAVGIYRRLAEAEPARYEADLAGSLNNLSIRLGDTGDNAGALEAIREAVEIRRRLAEAEPARYEPDLATSLANLNRILKKLGQNGPGEVEPLEG